MHSNRLFVAGILCALCTVATADVIDDFRLTDGSILYSENNLNRVGGSQAGLGSYVVGGSDHMFQNWWWFRAGGMTGERALANQIEGSAAGNQASLLYHEPVEGHGTLEFQLQYTVSDLRPGSVNPDHGLVQVAIGIRNLMREAVTVDFFSYTDFDLAGSAAGDLATINGAANQVQRINDQSLPVSADYIAGSTGLIGWEMAPFADIRNRLTDGAIDDLNNSGSPFGPGDYTGAFQWRVELAPAGSLGDTFTSSIVKRVEVVPEPAAVLLLTVGATLLCRRR